MTELKQRCVEALEKLQTELHQEEIAESGDLGVTEFNLARAVDAIFKILQPVQDRDISNLDEVTLFFQCALCFQEWQNHEAVGESMATYGRLQMGWTALGIQVWCRRHDCNVAHIDFEGMQHPANTTRLAR